MKGSTTHTKRITFIVAKQQFKPKKAGTGQRNICTHCGTRITAPKEHGALDISRTHHLSGCTKYSHTPDDTRREIIHSTGTEPKASMATITESEDLVDTDTESEDQFKKIDEAIELPYGSDSIFNNLWVYILLTYVFECLLFYSYKGSV